MKITLSARDKRIGLGVASIVAIGVLVAACGSTGTNDAQQQSQDVSNTIGEDAQAVVPYDAAGVKKGGYEERRLVNEHLDRESDKAALRYVVLLTQQGQVIAQYPLQGMVFDPNSQLTNTQNLETGYINSNFYSGAVESIGDNGTWGPEAGSAAFFTTSDVEIQIPAGLLWVESDSPLNITSKPIINYNLDEKPSTNHGALAGGK